MVTKLVDGKRIECTEEEVLAIQKEWEDNETKYREHERLYGYIQKRKADYPSIGDQLDALWHAMDKGILPKVDGFYEEIKQVKIKYKKPSEEEVK